MRPVVAESISGDAAGSVARAGDAELGLPTDGAQVGSWVRGKVGTIQGEEERRGDGLWQGMDAQEVASSDGTKLEDAGTGAGEWSFIPRRDV